MAQAVCEKPQTAIEEEVNQKFDGLTVSNRSAAKANEGGLSAEKDLDNANANAASDNAEKKNRIQVSNTKKPLFFYLNLAKRYIKQYNDVELSALGMAIPTVVTIAEILKANRVAVEKKVLTSTVCSKDETKGRLIQKAKIEIVLEKNNADKDPKDNDLRDRLEEKEA